MLREESDESAENKSPEEIITPAKTKVVEVTIVEEINNSIYISTAQENRSPKENEITEDITVIEEVMTTEEKQNSKARDKMTLNESNIDHNKNNAAQERKEVTEGHISEYIKIIEQVKVNKDVKITDVTVNEEIPNNEVSMTAQDSERSENVQIPEEVTLMEDCESAEDNEVTDEKQTQVTVIKINPEKSKTTQDILIIKGIENTEEIKEIHENVSKESFMKEDKNVSYHDKNIIEEKNIKANNKTEIVIFDSKISEVDNEIKTENKLIMDEENSYMRNKDSTTTTIVDKDWTSQISEQTRSSEVQIIQEVTAIGEIKTSENTNVQDLSVIEERKSTINKETDENKSLEDNKIAKMIFTEENQSTEDSILQQENKSIEQSKILELKTVSQDIEEYSATQARKISNKTKNDDNILSAEEISEEREATDQDKIKEQAAFIKGCQTQEKITAHENIVPENQQDAEKAVFTKNAIVFGRIKDKSPVTEDIILNNSEEGTTKQDIVFLMESNVENIKQGPIQDNIEMEWSKISEVKVNRGLNGRPSESQTTGKAAVEQDQTMSNEDNAENIEDKVLTEEHKNSGQTFVIEDHTSPGENKITE